VCELREEAAARRLGLHRGNVAAPPNAVGETPVSPRDEAAAVRTVLEVEKWVRMAARSKCPLSSAPA
jgi:hypothetical protein